MQLKNREQEIKEKIKMFDKVVSTHGDLFTFGLESIDAEDEYNWGGGRFYTYKNEVKIHIGVGYEKRNTIIHELAGVRILYDNMWEGLGLFVKKNLRMMQLV